MPVLDIDSEQERNRLRCLAEYHVLDHHGDVVLDDLAGCAAEFCSAPIAAVTFLGRQHEWFKAHHGISIDRLPRTQAISTHAIDSGDLLIVPDAINDRRFADHPLVTGDEKIRFLAACPLFSPEGIALGAVCVLDQESHELTDRQRRWLRSLTNDVRGLLELRREVYHVREANETQSKELESTRQRLAADSHRHERVEHELEERERQLRDAQRVAQMGSWEWDIAQDKVSWSDELYRIFGVDPAACPSSYENYLNHVHPEDRALIDQLVKTTLEKKSSFNGEHRVIHSSGQIRVVYCSGEVICDTEQQPLRMVGCCQDITQRRAMQDSLKASITLLNATLDATADGILVTDLDRRVHRWNEKFREMWNIPDLVPGVDHIQAIAKLVAGLRNPDNFLSRLKTIYEQRETESYDILEFTDGRIFERYSQPQKMGDKIVGRVWSFRDITARTLAQKTLRESEERYRTLVVATTHAVWTANADGDATEDSPSWRALTNQTFEAMRGRGWIDCIHPKDRVRINETWAHALASRTLYQAECRIRRADGKWRDMMLRGVPVLREDGSVREWVGVCQDITDRKQAERLIVQERDFSNALINSLPGIFYVLNPEGLNIRWNKNLEWISEYSPAELSRLRATDLVPPEQRELVKARIGKVFESGRAETEVLIRSKSGNLIPYYCTGVLATLDRKPHLVGVGIDISELKHAQEAIIRLNTELERRVQERTAQFKSANEELESFIYSASHDLRSPIRAVVGFARAIQDDHGSTLPQEVQEDLDRIIDAGDKMLQLIDDLLEYSTVGRSSIHVQPIALREFLSSLCDEFTHQKQPNPPQQTHPPQLPSVLGDRTLLTQIFRNLIQNSITYRRPEVPLRVAIDWSQIDHHATIKVTDNGIGIAPEHFPKIFEVFQRLHSDGQYSGTGIGLAIVRKAAEALGGKVSVESDVGKGATFSVILPLAISDS